MTLNTSVYVLDEIDPQALFLKCQQLVDSNEGTTWTDGDSWGSPGIRCLLNDPDQGLCAWTDVRYRPGGALVDEADAGKHDEDCEPDCTYRHSIACWAEASFDTAYSYNANGVNCGQLHVQIVTALGLWLDEQHLRWSWKNEYTGEIYQRFDGLMGLVGSSDQACAWFDGVVRPLIESVGGVIA